MNDLHYDEDVLIDYLTAPDEVAKREEIEQHLAVCTDCSAMLDGYKRFSESLSDPRVWEREEFSLALAKSDETVLEELMSYSEQLEKEENAAPEQVQALLAIDAEARKELLELSPRWWTVGVARELCELAHEQLDHSPKQALEQSSLAIQVGERLSTSAYRSGTVFHLRGRAWKEYAQALKMLGRYPEALQALDRSELAYAQATISEFDLATIAFVRASILRDLNRLSEALVLAQNSARVFADFGHHKRYLHARNLEAAIHYSSGDIRRARDIWTELLQPLRAEHDLQALAYVFNNLGSCCVELGDSHAASTYLLQAISIFRELGLKPSALLGQWTLGRMLVANRKFAEGLSRLRNVHEEYEALQMTAEAGVVALDMVEGLLASEKPEEAALICRYLVERFTACGMSANAITAVSYLREALAAGKATPVLAKHVRNYVAGLPRQGELLFLPPPV